MVGIGAYALAGLAEGAGVGMVNEARAKREAAIEDLKHQRQLSRDEDERNFRASENEKNRAITRAGQRSLIAGSDGTLHSIEGNEATPIRTPDGKPFSGTSTTKPRESDVKIANLMRRGVSRSDAEDIAYGIVKLGTHPVTGASVLVNIMTGESTPLVIKSPNGQPAGGDGAEKTSSSKPGDIRTPEQGGPSPVSAPQTLWGMSPESTGVIPAIKDLWNNVGPQIPGMEGTEFPKVTENRQQYMIATQALIRALSINPRFPVGEMDRIREEIDIVPNVFRSESAMKQRMRAVDAGLRRRLENERRAAADPNLPSDKRGAAVSAANDIENFLAILGVPQGDEANAPQEIKVPAGAVDLLLKDPSPEAQREFDEEFGAGAARSVLEAQ